MAADLPPPDPPDDHGTSTIASLAEQLAELDALTARIGVPSGRSRAHHAAPLEDGVLTYGEVRGDAPVPPSQLRAAARASAGYAVTLSPDAQAALAGGGAVTFRVAELTGATAPAGTSGDAVHLRLLVGVGEDLPTPAAYDWATPDARGPAERAVTVRGAALAGRGAALRAVVLLRGPASAARSYRVGYEVVPLCAAEPLEAGVPLTRTCGQDMVYFRYTHHGAAALRQLVTVRAAPVRDSGGATIGDPDLYVSNACGGVGALRRDRYCWKSTNVGADRVDVHPDDPLAAQGDVFLIGVLGYKDHNKFVVSVAVSTPQPIVALAPEPGLPFTCAPVPVEEGELAYFSVPAAPRPRGARIRLSVTARRPGGDGPGATSAALEDGFESLSKLYGRGVYCEDPRHRTLTAAGALNGGGRGPAAAAGAPSPMVYLSSTFMYPTDDEYTWRASSWSSQVPCLLECDEWRYTATLCHFGVRVPAPLDAAAAAAGGPAAAPPPPPPSPAVAAVAAAHRHLVDDGGGGPPRPPHWCELVVRAELVLEEDVTPPELRAAHAVFSAVYDGKDAAAVSQADRAAAVASAAVSESEAGSFTYGEIEFAAFADLLAQATEVCRVAPRGGGRTFYDLGCGAGKPGVVAALATDLGYGRCVGIELLDGLFDAAEAALGRLRGGGGGGGAAAAAKIALLHGSFLELDWSDADVVYTSSICFTASLMEAMAVAARRLKPGAVFVTLKMLPGAGEYFETVRTGWFKMTWGRINVYLLRRRGWAEVA